MSGERLGKAKVLIHTRIGEPLGCVIENLPRHVGFPLIERYRLDHRIHSLEEVRIADVQVLKSWRARRTKVAIEMKVGRQLLHVGNSHLVVEVLGIASQRAVHRRLGQLRLNLHHCIGALLCLRWTLTDHGQHLLHVLEELLANLHRLLIVFEVVVAVGKRQTGLIDKGNGHVCVMKVRARAEAKQRVRTDRPLVRHYRNHLPLIFDFGDAVELRLERRDSFLIDRLLVHARGIVVADLLHHRTALRIIRRRFFENVVQYREIVLVDLREAVPRRIIRRNGIVLDPVAAGELIEVHTRIGGFVEVGNIKLGCRTLRRCFGRLRR